MFDREQDADSLKKRPQSVQAEALGGYERQVTPGTDVLTHAGTPPDGVCPRADAEYLPNVPSDEHPGTKFLLEKTSR